MSSQTPDLRAVWPERQLQIREQYTRSLGTRSWAAIQLPFLDEFIRQCGGKMPRRLQDMDGTVFAQNLGGFAAHMLRAGRWPLGVAQQQVNMAARFAFHVEWWEHEGHRIYVLDETTALALAHTKIDDVPTEMLRLPVNSFYLRLPSVFGWKLDVNEREFEKNEWSTDPTRPRTVEAAQPIEGVMVTGQFDESGTWQQLNLLANGRSQQLEGDHAMWIELNMQKPTLGDVVTQWLEPNTPEDGKHVIPVTDADRTLLQVTLGALLYITHVHPQLETIQPLKTNVLTKRLKQASTTEQRDRLKNRSRYAITYVGGPSVGVVSPTEVGEPTTTTGKPRKPHMRAGHWRHQWVGARDSEHRHQELRWIRPVWVGSWDRVLQYETVQNMQFVIRKTRPAQEVESSEPV